MKKLLNIILILPVLLNAQNLDKKKQEFIEIYNELRVDKKYEKILDNEKLAFPLQLINENSLNAKSSEKNDVTKVLREYGFFDSHYEIMEFEVKKSEVINENYINDNIPKLNESNYNNLGLFCKEKESTYQFTILLSHRYITIEKVQFQIEISDRKPEVGKKQTIMLNGFVLEDDIQYAVISKLEDEPQILKQLEIKDGIFEITIENEDSYTVFYNNKRERVSIFHNLQMYLKK